MSERPIRVKEDIAEKVGVNIAALDRQIVNYVELSNDEKKYVSYAFDSGIAHLQKVLPSIAGDIARQKDLVLMMAGVAKATFPVRKNFAYPSVPGSLGVAWLFPQGLKWVATPSSTNPCYTSYKTNSWDIDVTAGTKAYLLGDGTNFYKTNPNTDTHTFILIFDNGVLEVGSTPSIEQFHIYTEGKRDYGAYTIEPLTDIPIEKNVAIYQYPTPLGAMFVDYNRGVMWGFMPRVTGTKTIKLLGIIFYEHNFLASPIWAT
jgi:hypothetical protein